MIDLNFLNKKYYACGSVVLLDYLDLDLISRIYL